MSNKNKNNCNIAEVINSPKYAMLNSEKFSDYCYRISTTMLAEKRRWDEIASLINARTGNDYSPDRYRKNYKKMQKQNGTYVAPKYKAKINSVNNATATHMTPAEYEDKLFETNEGAKLTVNYDKNEFGSTKSIPLTAEDLASPEKVLKAHGFDPNEFNLKSATHIKRQRTNSKGEIIEYYNSTVRVAPGGDLAYIIKQIAESLKDYKSNCPVVHHYEDSDDYLVIPMYDFHFGRFADTSAGKFERYDIKEEKKYYLDHFAKYISKFKGRHFKGIYLIVGQDFLNSSFTGYTTSQSHLQSNAVDFKTMYEEGAQLLLDIVDMFADFGNELHVIGSLGNHDTAEEMTLFVLLKSHYRNNPNIIVDSEMNVRKYLKLGVSCIGIGHLDKEGKRIYTLMQSEAKEMFAETTTHIWLAGHLHHFEVNSEGGIEVYRIPSICKPDKWTVDNGYTQNEPKSMCFVFNENEGLTETHFMYL